MSDWQFVWPCVGSGSAHKNWVMYLNIQICKLEDRKGRMFNGMEASKGQNLVEIVIPV